MSHEVYYVTQSAACVISRCKLAPAKYKLADVNWHWHNTNVVIIWCLHKVFEENKFRLK